MRERTATDRWIFSATLALTFWLPLPWGSHPPWASDLLVALCATLLGLRLLLMAAGAIHARPGLARQLLFPAVWWALWLAWIGAQLLPLSPAALHSVSPASAELHQQAGALLEAPYVPTVSIAPASTVDAWLLSWGYACLYLLILISCHADRKRASLVLGAVATAGFVQATYGSLMVLSGLEWGFFAEKEHYRHVATGTFVNRNHLAGYLGLAGAAALGLVLSDLGGGASRNWRQRVLAAIALVFSTKMRARLVLAIIAVALVITRSRMGNIAFFASVCLCGMLFIMLRKRQYAMPAFVLFSSIVAIDILVLSNWYGLDRVVARIESTDVSTEGRAVFLEEVPPALEAYRWVGSGLGTFSVAFAPYRSPRMTEYFDHAHNDYIEFGIETGVVGVAMLAAFVLAHAVHALRVLVNRRRRIASAVAFAALMSIAAQMIHATAEFNLQIPATACTLLIILALSASWSSRSERQDEGALPVRADPGRMD